MVIIFWIAVYFLLEFLNIYVLFHFTGIRVNLLIELVLATLIALAMSKKWDKFWKRRKQEEYAQGLAASGLTEFEYILSRLPETRRSYIQTHAGNQQLLENYVQQLIRGHLIDQRQGDILMQGLLGQSKEFL